MKKSSIYSKYVSRNGFTSCDDFLTVSSPDKLTTGNFGETKRCRSHLGFGIRPTLPRRQLCHQ